jgi:hypothetical protein
MMDRSDEVKNENVEREPEAPARQGDILGLSDVPATSESPVGAIGRNPKQEDIRANEDDGRTLSKEDERAPGARELRRTPGATSIDMGAGGTGTDIER